MPPRLSFEDDQRAVRYNSAALLAKNETERLDCGPGAKLDPASLPTLTGRHKLHPAGWRSRPGYRRHAAGWWPEQTRWRQMRLCKGCRCWLRRDGRSGCMRTITSKVAGSPVKDAEQKVAVAAAGVSAGADAAAGGGCRTITGPGRAASCLRQTAGRRRTGNKLDEVKSRADWQVTEDSEAARWRCCVEQKSYLGDDCHDGPVGYPEESPA